MPARWASSASPFQQSYSLLEPLLRAKARCGVWERVLRQNFSCARSGASGTMSDRRDDGAEGRPAKMARHGDGDGPAVAVQDSGGEISLSIEETNK